MVARNKQLATLAHNTGVINSSLDLEETRSCLREVSWPRPFPLATLPGNPT
jgi:hypothetical protein